jgi:hypothetical protein
MPSLDLVIFLERPVSIRFVNEPVSTMKSVGFLFIDDGWHDELVATTVDAGPVLHGWGFEAVVVAEIIGRTASQGVKSL